MASFRLKTAERRIGILGSAWSGKTVFLTSLINHLRYHDPQRFHIGKKDQQGEIIRFRELPQLAKEDSIAWFDYEGHRNQLVRQNRWPAKTRDFSQYVCRFERTDWFFNDVLLRLYDLPGERVNDLPMLNEQSHPPTAYAHWSDLVLKRIEADIDYRQAFEPFIHECQTHPVRPTPLVYAYKLGLAKLRLAYKPYLTPSTFLLDREGNRISGREPEKLAESRYCGLNHQEEFVPLPEQTRKSNLALWQDFSLRFSEYRKQVVLPVARILKSCDALLILVDILAVLAHGSGMYCDARQLVEDVVRALSPKEKTGKLIGRYLSHALLPHQIRPSWIHRVGFVVPKVDRVPFADRSRLKGLLQQMTRTEASTLQADGIRVEYFPTAAMVGAREIEGSPRELMGSTLYDEHGNPLEPGPERKFTVPKVPDTWPESSWQPGVYIFPDVYPRISPLHNNPTQQIGLDEIFNFCCW